MAGIKSSIVANTSEYGIVVVGGLIIAGSPTASVKDYLNNLSPGHSSQCMGPYILTRVGVLGSGQGVTLPSDLTMIRNSVSALSINGTLSSAVVMKIWQTIDLNTRASDFVNQLVK